MKDGMPFQSITWTRQPGNDSHGIASNAVAGVCTKKSSRGRELPALVLVELGLVVLALVWWF